MKGACTQLLVSLRNADPSALTALGALQRSLGFQDRLRMVSRRVLWELSGPPGDNPTKLIESLRRGGEIWNPNKEAAMVRPLGEPVTSLGNPSPGSEDWVMALAWDPERDRNRIPAALRPYVGRGYRLARGVIWGLCWGRGSKEEQRRWSEEAAICRGPTEGLLIHPHLEDFRWIAGEEAVPWLPSASAEGAAD